MSEHLCVVCARREYERGIVCEGCRGWLRHVLSDIATLCGELPAHIEPAVSGGPKVSGSREAALPIVVDVFDLAAPARPAGWALLARGPRGFGIDPDQIGTLSAATVLDRIARAWADTLGHRLPTSAVPGNLVNWLDVRLDDACNDHMAIDEDAEELRELRTDLRRACGTAPERPNLLRVPCPACDAIATYRPPGDERTHCGACGRIFDPDVYERMMSEQVNALREVG